MKPLKVACISITGGDVSGGFKTHLSNLIPRIASHPDIESLLCIAPSSIKAQEFCTPHPKVRYSECAPFNIFYTNRDVELHRALTEFSPDIVFIPLARYLSFNKTPVVNMILNMEPFAFNNRKNPLIDQIKNIAQYHITRKAVKMSQRVIAVSHFIQNFMIEKLNIPADKIGLVYPGVEALDNVSVNRPMTLPDKWDEKFIFTMGSVRPARGLEDIIEAMPYLKSRSIKLVILGNASSTMESYKNSLSQRIINSGLAEYVKWLPSLSYEEMLWCYKNCSVFVMTSRVEACSNITLEAMSAGCISVSTKNPPMPEIFDDAALYYKAGDGKELADVVTTAFDSSESERLLMRTRARKRAAYFSWEITANKTVEQFKIAIEAKNS